MSDRVDASDNEYPSVDCRFRRDTRDSVVRILGDYFRPAAPFGISAVDSDLLLGIWPDSLRYALPGE